MMPFWILDFGFGIGILKQSPDLESKMGRRLAALFAENLCFSVDVNVDAAAMPPDER